MTVRGFLRCAPGEGTYLSQTPPPLPPGREDHRESRQGGEERKGPRGESRRHALRGGPVNSVQDGLAGVEAGEGRVVAEQGNGGDSPRWRDGPVR